MKRLVCLLFGHNWLCVYRHGGAQDQVTAWKCGRCGKTKKETWHAW